MAKLRHSIGSWGLAGEWLNALQRLCPSVAPPTCHTCRYRQSMTTNDSEHKSIFFIWQRETLLHTFSLLFSNDNIGIVLVLPDQLIDQTHLNFTPCNTCSSERQCEISGKYSITFHFLHKTSCSHYSTTVNFQLHRCTGEFAEARMTGWNWASRSSQNIKLVALCEGQTTIFTTVLLSPRGL